METRYIMIEVTGIYEFSYEIGCNVEYLYLELSKLTLVTNYLCTLVKEVMYLFDILLVIKLSLITLSYLHDCESYIKWVN